VLGPRDGKPVRLRVLIDGQPLARITVPISTTMEMVRFPMNGFVNWFAKANPSLNGSSRPRFSTLEPRRLPLHSVERTTSG
jgi:hypothetical protein